MSRHTDGWEYTDDGPRWAPTVSVAMANILTGLYGAEYDQHRRELEDLVRAARRDAAEIIRAHEPPEFAGDHFDHAADAYDDGLSDAADLIFPEYPEES